LLFGSLIYIALILGVMLWRNIGIEPQWVLLALLLIALVMGRGGQFLADWTPFLVLFFGYEAMRLFADKAFAPHDISGLERALFGGQLPSLVLQHRFYHADVISPYDWAALVAYFMHFPLPILAGFLFWANDRSHYWRFISALLLLCFLSFVTYLFWPSTPPWLQFPQTINGQLNPDWIIKINDETIHKWGMPYVSGIYRFNPNRYAAFPSLHAAFPFLAAMYAWRRYRLASIVLLAWTAVVCVGIVYVGEHYLVDALAGFVYAVVALATVEAFVRWRATAERRQASPAEVTDGRRRRESSDLV
jgi:membrane-associated phospholipid phosphatase